MAAKKTRQPRKTAASPAPETKTGTKYPVRPGEQGPESRLDNRMIHEWDPENPLAIDVRPPQDEEAMDFIAEGAGLEEAIHADDFRRLSPEEFDEFDGLLEDDPRSLAHSPASPQLRLLTEDDLPDDFDELPGSSGGGNPADPVDTDFDPPVDVVGERQEDPAMNDSQTTRDQAPSYYQAVPEDGVPAFEDHGMRAGFFATDDEMPPSEAPLPEEAEFIPPPASEEEKPVEPQQFVADLFFDPGPTLETHPAPVPVGDLPPDMNIISREITDDLVSRMMYRAELARRRINDEIDSIELARELLELIRSATTLILSGKDKYEEAERSLNEVEYRLSYSRRVKVWSDAIAYRLLTYEVFWLLVLGLGALFIPSILSAAIGELNTFSPSSLPDFIHADDLFLGVSTALWGGLGGVVGAMYALWRHVSLKQDFNPQHKMWYYTQPIMGIPIGVVIFLIVRIGIGYTVEGVLDFSSPYGIYMLAWIAGFQQNILYEIIRQILKIFRVQN